MRDRYLLDTNVVSRVLKGTSPRAVERLSATSRSKVGVSVVTHLELEFGLAKHPSPGRLRPVVESFLRTVAVHEFPPEMASTYGHVRWELERAGRPIGPLDTLIAAHAVALGMVLVTNNAREFGRVQGLRCEDWT